MKILLVTILLALVTSCTVKPDNSSSSVSSVESQTITLSARYGITENSIYLYWNKVNGATQYTLYVSENDTASPSALVTTQGNSYLHSGLEAGKTNYYRIESDNQIVGEFIMAFTKAELPLGDPSNATIVTNGAIVFSYNPDTELKPSNELVILTLNMHTYQETGQDAKFNLIVDAIAKIDADVITLQECAQHKNSNIVSGIIRSDNMAKILCDRLKAYYNLDYHFTWDWAHYGWSVWEEGVAVLSKYPILATSNKYVSASTGTSSIISRKAIYSHFEHPHVGKINAFSTHLHWRTSETDTEQNNQIINLRNWATEKETEVGEPVLTIICGDYNCNPTDNAPWNEGYLTMVNNGEYVDTYFAANPTANNKPALAQHHTILGDFPGRIDYIFMKTNDNFTVISSQIVFKTGIIGVVSDHYGVITRIRKVQ